MIFPLKADESSVPATTEPRSTHPHTRKWMDLPWPVTSIGLQENIRLSGGSLFPVPGTAMGGVKKVKMAAATSWLKNANWAGVSLHSYSCPLGFSWPPPHGCSDPLQLSPTLDCCSRLESTGHLQVPPSLQMGRDKTTPGLPQDLSSCCVVAPGGPFHCLWPRVTLAGTGGADVWGSYISIPALHYYFISLSLFGCLCYYINVIILMSYINVSSSGETQYKIQFWKSTIKSCFQLTWKCLLESLGTSWYFQKVPDWGRFRMASPAGSNTETTFPLGAGP